MLTSYNDFFFTKQFLKHVYMYQHLNNLDFSSNAEKCIALIKSILWLSNALKINV